MKSLSEKSFLGMPLWSKYVSRNKYWSKAVFNSRPGATVYTRGASGLIEENLLEYSIAVSLASNTIQTIGKKRVVKIKSRSGYWYISPNNLMVNDPIEGAISGENLSYVLNSAIFQNNNCPIDIKIPGTDKFEGIISSSVIFGSKANTLLFDNTAGEVDSQTIYIRHLPYPESAQERYISFFDKRITKELIRNSEIGEFLEKVAGYYQDGYLTEGLYSDLFNSYIINKAVFGLNYGSKKGLDNIHILGIGNAHLTSRKEHGLYELKFDTTIASGRSSGLKNNQRATVVARPGEGSFEHEGEFYGGVDIFIAPRGMVRDDPSLSEIV